MSEKENEAIIDFEREVEDGRMLQSDIILSLDSGIIISELIKKQQKEIKELKWKENEQKELLKYKTDRIDQQRKEIEELKKKSYKCEYLEEGAEEIIKNSIGKDKIREKIKELVNKNVEVLGADRYEYAVRVLQELLED